MEIGGRSFRARHATGRNGIAGDRSITCRRCITSCEGFTGYEAITGSDTFTGSDAFTGSQSFAVYNTVTGTDFRLLPHNKLGRDENLHRGPFL